METGYAKIRINLSSREMEIEGSESFLKNYEDLIAEYANIIKDQPLSKKQASSKEVNNDEDSSMKESFQSSSTPSFGEFYTKFSKTLNKDVDKVLVAGYYIQMTNESKSFTTREASSLLIQQNIKLTNPSAFIKLNLDTRKIFRLNNRDFRVSDIGIAHVESFKENKS